MPVFIVTLDLRVAEHLHDDPIRNALGKQQRRAPVAAR